MGTFPIRRLATIVLLTGAWCALWGEITAANALSGLAMAVLVTIPALAPSFAGGVRIVPLARFVFLVAVDLVASTFSVAKEVLTPTDHTHEAIVAVDMPEGTDPYVVLLVVVITVTPGTAVVDVDPDTGTFYLHLLHGAESAKTAAHVQELAKLAQRALPLPERSRA